jgi:hypothetical protein
VEDVRLVTRPWGFGLEDLSLRMRIWQGEYDLIHPAVMARHLAEHIPRAEPTLVPGPRSLWALTGLRPVLEALVP